MEKDMTPEEDACPICEAALKKTDICATDIELGICHAECLKGSPVVDLDTGKPLADAEIETFTYGEAINPSHRNIPPEGPVDPFEPASYAPEFVRLSENRQGNWMQTFTGRKFWPIDPRPEDVCIEDIAHALAMTCRYGGHCNFFYSVAEHSVLISHQVRDEDALWGLLHDAAEAYISDIIRPAKPFLTNYKLLENNLMSAICERFNLPLAMPESVRWADEAILAYEMKQVMCAPPEPWNLRYREIGVSISGLMPVAAKKAFLDRFYELVPAAREEGSK
ncbi:hypothetical protein [Allorhizobium undicola]|uniref:hypothetical protein n=1 Tax=Allorhizobium undicola TaxID=78527 RepID=UPI001FD8CB66|nr:hypothetical protein [Allorhizobium undicola]